MVPFLSIASCSDKTEKGTLFLSILPSLKTIGKGVKFQDITPIRATFTNTIANGINNSYPFYLTQLTEVSEQNAYIYTVFYYK